MRSSPPAFWPRLCRELSRTIAGIGRFAEHKHLAQYAGLTWEKRSSGNFVSQNTRLTKVGNKYLRYYLILGADKLRLFNLEYKAFYWRKYSKVSKYQRKRALVLTARKLVRLVHALLTKNVPYVRPQALAHVQQGGTLQQVTLRVTCTTAA